ncbi:MAG TPA: universal stress protein [Nitrospiraceae bacterium]|nr:universal stress protein [Nitrospiraceae bacterium]
MKAVIGMDLSQQSSAAVAQIGLLYHLDDVVLVHGAQAESTQGYDEFRQTMREIGRQVVERCRALMPAGTSSIRSMVDVQNLASSVLDCAANTKADLVVMGTRNLSRLDEAFSGSVSARVATHSTVPTLVVKGDARPVTSALFAVHDVEDATRLHRWLIAHPFESLVRLTILKVISFPHMVSEHAVVEGDVVSRQSRQRAEQVVNDAAQIVAGPHFTVSTNVLVGDPVRTICEVGKNHDLIVVSSHGRKGLSRFLMGSVSEEVVNRADCSVLVLH